MSESVSSLCPAGHSIRPAVYEGDDISGIARITVDKETKMAGLHINSAGKWKLFAGASVEAVDFSDPVAYGDGSGEETVGLGISDTRRYYQLVSGEGKAILAERFLPMAGAYNIRDIGGLRNKEGRFVKWGKMLRADDLFQLTNADLNYLSAIPVKGLVDFREKEEQNLRPDRIPESVGKQFNLPIDPGNVISLKKIVNMTPSEIDRVMEKIYVYLVTEKESVERYKAFFKMLQDDMYVPVLFHCSAGKDRTGMGAALILYALGVDEQTIMDDYLASNVGLEGKFARELAMVPNLKSALMVKEEFLQSAIYQVKQTYGSMKTFLEDVLEVDISDFKEKFLY